MLFLINMVVVYSLIWVEPCTSSVAIYIAHKPRRLRAKLTKLDGELTMDVMTKIKSIQHIKEMYYRTPEFQVASVVYGISRKRRQMMLYHERSQEDTTDNHECIRLLAEIQKLSMDVEHLTQVMDNWEMEQEKKSKIHDRMNYLRAGEVHKNVKERRMQILMAPLKKFVPKDSNIAENQNGPDDGFDTEG